MQIHRKMFISAHVADNSPLVNELRTLELKDDLTKLKANFKRVKGCYKGLKETSFMVDTPDNVNDYNAIRKLAWKYNQECLLIFDRTGIGALHDKNGNVDIIGFMKEVTDYTMIEGKVFTTKPIGQLDSTNVKIRNLNYRDR